MISYKRIPASVIAAIVPLLAVLLSSCTVSSVPGRFTYIVKYEVTAEFTTTSPDTVSINYDDDTGNQTPAAFTPPQSFEFTMSYDYGTPFNPEMTFNSANFTDVGDKITMKIIWKDYRVDFQEELLAVEDIEYTGVAPAAVTIYGTQLPK